jgi:hypothetical protein
MGAVDYVIALEQEMELVPLKRGWWVAFGAPGLTAAKWGSAPPRPRPKAATASVSDPPPRPTRQ